MSRMNLLSSYILGIKATRGRVCTPKAYAKENWRLAYNSHEVCGVRCVFASLCLYVTTSRSDAWRQSHSVAGKPHTNEAPICRCSDQMAWCPGAALQ